MTTMMATILLLLHAVNNAGASSDFGLQPEDLQKIIFPSPRSTDNYARLNTTLSQELTSFTMCLHMRTDINPNRDMGLVSYAVGGSHYYNELLLFRDGDKFRLYVSDPNTNTPSVNLPVWDGAWHAICATWRSSDGAWQIYSDGVLRGSGSGFKEGEEVRSGGTWILGQDQDSVGGRFDVHQAFSGELSQMNLWDRVLSPAEIATNWTVSCNPHGNVIDWTAIDIDVFGNANSDKYDCESETPDYTSLGCWTDDEDRAIPTLEMTDPLLEDNYRQRTNAIEKCYLVAFSGGLTVFAVQNGGWCAGSADANNTYSKYGRSTACRGDGEGGWWANEVYQITAANTTNIALDRLANQSSTDDGGDAGRAVDGNRNPIWNGESCTHTTKEPNPWWRVDLGSTKYVERVVVVNRNDNCCWRRLNDFHVHVGDNSSVEDNPPCGGAQSVAGRDVIFIINCGGLAGRYVGVTLRGASRILTLCEVEIYEGRTMEQSTPTSPTTPDVTSNMVFATVNVSLTLTVPSSVNLSLLRDSIKQNLKTRVKEFCGDQCEIGEISLHIVTDTTRARKKRQTDDKVQIIVTIQLILSASQGGNTSIDRDMAEDLLQKNADLLRQLARSGKLLVDFNGKTVPLIENSDEDKNTSPWVIGVICAVVAVMIIIAVVTVLLCRRKHNPDANMPGKSGNEMKNLDTPERRDHSNGEGSVDNIIYNTEDEGFVDNVIYNAGDDGTVDNVIYQGQDSTPNDPENAPESQYESVY